MDERLRQILNVVVTGGLLAALFLGIDDGNQAAAPQRASTGPGE